MSHKDRARTRDQTRHNQTSVVPFSSLLGILAKRVEIGRSVPAQTPQSTLPMQTMPRTQPTSTPHTPQVPNGLTGRGTGLVAQDVIRWYQKTQSWRKVAHWMHIPLAELREWVRSHANDLGVLGSEALSALLHPVPIPRASRREGRSPAEPRERPMITRQPSTTRIPASPAPNTDIPSMLPKATHWSGLHFSRETQEALAQHSQRIEKAEPEYFRDVFDASVLQDTADEIGIGSGVLEALVKAAGGLLVNNSVFVALRTRRGERTLAAFLEESYDANRIDTVARDLSVSTNQYMQLIQCLCPHLLQGVTA